MGLIRINPTKLLFGGDKIKAREFIGPARSQLEILKTQMSFQKLAQGVRRLWLNDDVFVECACVYNHQECRIWVRPQPVEDKPVLERIIYFYIRIVKSTTAPDLPTNAYGEDEDIKFLNKRRDNREKTLDRLILFQCRKERRTGSYISVAGKQSGEYEDGTGWVITEPGKVVLDVDVIGRTVYSESGGVSVETIFNEEQQLALADKYIEIIDKNEQADIADQIPIDIASQSIIRGEIYSPLDIAEACYTGSSVEDLSFEAYFSDPVEILTASYKDWYHVIWDDYDLMILDLPYLTTCSDQTAKFFGIQWPGLDTNKTKYLPTKRQYRDTFTYPGGDQSFISDWNIICDGPAYSIRVWKSGADCTGTFASEVVDQYIIAEPSYIASPYPGTYHKSCQMISEFEEIEHLAGNYFTSDGTYPCFFVTLAGRTQAIMNKLIGGSWSTLVRSPYSPSDPPRWWTGGIECEPIEALPVGSPWPYELGRAAQLAMSYDHGQIPVAWSGFSEFNYIEYSVSPGSTFLSTPLEQAILSIEYMQGVSQDGDIPQWMMGLLSFTGGAAGSFFAYGKDIMGWAVSAYPSLSSELNTQLLNPLSTIQTSINTPTGTTAQYWIHKCDLEIAITSKTEDFASTFSFVKFYQKPHAALVAYREMNVDAEGTRTQYNEDVENFESQSFEVGIIFYIMYPKHDIRVENGTTTYWDIHSERESSQEEINHNRELNLEDYVGAILQEIKELPGNYESGMYQILKSKNYDMTTGFVEALH